MDPDRMSRATLGGVAFRLNPLSVRWDWTVKTKADPTIGGKVVQVFGLDPGDISVTGSFGIGGWEEQQAFLDRMKRLADSHLVANARPIRFFWPSFGWDFQVWLKSYTGEGPAAIQLSNTVVAPQWTLALSIVEDNLSLRQVAADQYIARLSEGLGWQQSEFNGGMDFTDLQETLARRGVSTLPDYFAVGYGVSGGVPLGNLTTGPQPGADGRLSREQVVTIAHGAGFTGEALAIAVAISEAESGFDPRALRPESKNPGGGRDRGLWQINSKAHPQYDNDEEMFDPGKNAQAAWIISSGGTNWKPWWAGKRKLERIESRLPEARAAAKALGYL